MTKFEVGAKVQDRDGFEGRIAKVTEWEGRVWYDIKFPSGCAVRYPEDLKEV